MNIDEMSDKYDVMLVSYLRFKKFDSQAILDSIEINEYEKSIYLTKAQNEIVMELYSGKSVFGSSYEQTEELRRYLSNLNRVDTINTFEAGIKGVAKESVFCRVSPKLMYITLESCLVISHDALCEGREVEKECTPILRDEYNIIKNNPYKNNKVWRVDHSNDIIELISKHEILEYTLSYLETPEPIILEDISPYTIHDMSDPKECLLHPIIHEYILERAVQNTLRDIIRQQPQETN